MRITVWVVSTCIIAGFTSDASAGENADSLRLLMQQYQARHAEFVQGLEDVATLADVVELSSTSAAIRQLGLPFEEQTQDVDDLPEEIQAELPFDLSVEERHWRAQLRQVRSEYAQDLYLLSRKALPAHVSFAFRLVREVAFHDPDHSHARRLLGYVRHEDRWVTPYARQMLKTGNVWHEQFGWLPNSHVERYAAGQRNYRGRWMSAADEAVLRHDFNNAWEIKTDHFLIRTNHSQERGVEIGVLLEKFHRFFHREFAAAFDTPQQMQQLFEGISTGRRTPQRHLIHYYQSREEFVFRLRAKQSGIEASNGLYMPRDRTTYAFYPAADSAAEQAALLEANEETLLHEVTHQLLSESQLKVPEVGRDANFWLVEGIACYLESFEIDKQGLIHVGDPRHIRIDNARTRLLSMNFFIPLQQFTDLGMNAFQNFSDEDLLRGYYSQASGLTHFFLHYEDGLYRDAFIEHLSQAYSPNVRISADPASLAELTGVPIDELGRQYRSYLTEMQSALDLAGSGNLWAP